MCSLSQQRLRRVQPRSDYAGDSVAFVVEHGRVWLRRAEPLDREFARALSGTMSEWLSQADDEAYREL
jgi:antitoxin PrlF